jgi:RimJ/RimL family protein N-acetyltransferase
MKVELHAQKFVELTASHPELYAHMPSGPYVTRAEFVSQFIEKISQPNPGWVTFAIIDKTRGPSAEDEDGELAGIVSYMNTSTVHLSTEIGFIVIPPPYQRTHVTTNAVGLMLQFALDGAERGGIGLRRVQWLASSMNNPSIRAAERLGFTREGVLRWHMMFRQGAQNGKAGTGRALPPGSDDGDFGRDTVVLGLCWDDWENGARHRVQELMARTR